MNYKAMIKKQSTIIAIAVICLTIATIGISYAIFFQVETNTNNQIVTAGTLNVEYGSGSSSITATELLPMSDDEALTTSTMTGTIFVQNSGTLPALYEVALGNDTESFDKRANAADTDKLLSHDYLKVAAYLNGDLIVKPTTLSSLEASEHNTDLYKLFSGYIDVTGTGNSTMTIVIKVWIDEEAPEEIIGDFVYLKMDITSEVDEYIADGGTHYLKNTIVSRYGGYDNITTLSSFSNATTEGEEGLFKATDDYGTSYYFRGDVSNNYVKFGSYAADTTLSVADYDEYGYSTTKTVTVKAGDPMYWRIVRINGDGTIRMIYDGTSPVQNGTAHTAIIANKAYGSAKDAKYAGYTYTDDSGNQVDSAIKSVVDTWYLNNLYKNYEKYIADSIFCNDKVVTNVGSYQTDYAPYTRLSTNKAPILTCTENADKYTAYDTKKGNGYLTYPVGLLTADEAAMAGGVRGIKNQSYYLYSKEVYWTMSSFYYYNNMGMYMFYIRTNGEVYGDSGGDPVTSNKGVRPVINLKSDLIFTGLGTKEAPYEIAELAE